MWGMATLVSDLRAILLREVNVPGFEQLPDITPADLDGYIKDGFWEAHLSGLVQDYTQTDGTEFATPTGDVIKATADDGDLPKQFEMLVVIFAALRMLRLKLLNLAVNFSASAGPVSYEQQASATTLRAVLATLEARVKELKEIYSDEIGGGAFIYFDSVLQRASSVAFGDQYLQVI
jgi:hypothetical protein